MKKIIALALLVLLLPQLILSQPVETPGGEGNRPDIDSPPTDGNQSSSSEERKPIKEEDLVKRQRKNIPEAAQSISQIRERTQKRYQEMDEEIQGLPENIQKIYRNQNRVRESVHNLLYMRQMLEEKGGIGDEVSEIAMEFNNSVQATLKVEERIQTRGMLRRLLLGGDEEAADELEQEVNGNEERIRALRELEERIEDEEIKQIFQEQIQQIEQEQNRLQKMANREKRNKGLFGWLFKE